MARVAPHTWIMDNEASLELEAALKRENMKSIIYTAQPSRKSGRDSHSYLQESLCGRTGIIRPKFSDERMG